MSDEVNIDQLTQFARGLEDKQGYLVSGKNLKLFSSIAEQLWAGRNMRVSGGLRMNGSYGQGVSLDGGQGGVSAGNAFPWKVSTRTNPDDPSGKTFQASVYWNSDLMRSLTPNDNLTVTGLSSQPTETGDGRNWFDLIANDAIWIYIKVQNYSPVSATIESYGMGKSGFNPTFAAWNNDGGYVQDDRATNPQQLAANLLIAYSEPDANGNPFLYQNVFQHLVIQNCCIDGRAAIYPFPSPIGRYAKTVPGT